MDLATLLGAAVALAGVVGGLRLGGGTLEQLLEPAAAAIVLGGTAGAVLVAYPLDAVVGAVRAAAGLLVRRPTAPEAILREVLFFATTARKEGMLAVDRRAGQASDPFLRDALALAADEKDAGTVRHVLELRLAALEDRLERAARVLESAGGTAPTLGILGAVLGLIQVMGRLDDLASVGQGIATAFVATLYGLGLANLVLLPAATKIRDRQREELLVKEMIVEGVVAIQQGLTAYAVEDRLRALLVDDAAEAA